MNWLSDLRFAVRMIRVNPWFSAAIVVTLALGIGANTTVFTLVNAVLHKPLPFPGGERLVMVFADNIARGRDRMPMSWADYGDYQQAAGAFERLEAYRYTRASISEKGNAPEQLRGIIITTGMFDMLQTKPVAGRGFVAADGKPGAERVALIGHSVWKDRYGLSPDVVGRTVRLNEKPAVIIGVMPEGFKFPNDQDLWLPASPEAGWEKRDQRDFQLIGMLKPDRSLTDAQADLGIVAKRLEQQFPASHKDHGVRVNTFHQAMNGGPIRLVFLLMLGAVGFVLLIACANVANMLLSRSVARTREMSIRAAMGASRWQIIRQLLTESVLLSLAGGSIGLALSYWGVAAFSKAVENVGKPYWIDFSMDYVVFLYFAVVSIAAGVLFGIAPAWQSSKVDLNTSLKDGTRTSGGLRAGYLSGALVVVQFTLAVVLLSGAGLMMRSFVNAQQINPGVPGDRILSAVIDLPNSRYANPADRQQLFGRLLPRLQAMPGAQAVSMVSNPPGTGSGAWRYEVEGRPLEKDRRPSAAGLTAAPGYFPVVGLSLLRGRDFYEQDGDPGKDVAIVNQQFVAKNWPGEDGLGKRIRLFNPQNEPRPWLTIVGVVQDFQQTSPGSDSRAGNEILFVPYRMDSYNSMVLLVRTAGSPASMVSALRKEVQELDQDLPLFQAGALQGWLERGRWHLRVFGTVFSIFAMIAMGMAAVGIYAVMAHATTRRTQEIGVRVALGAGVRDILSLVLSRGLKQLGIGMVLGIAAAVGVCQLMAGLLFQVSARDPLTFALVGGVLGLAGLAACWLPARRASKLDPLKALRYE
ncbi:MAG: ABC transporter permease [Acidobacteria bacterium]|nr:ABC transporter permease [Acidobacteriota bacterium]